MNYRIISWNVNGIRAVEKKGFLEFVEKEQPDILCLQETKAQPDQIPEKLIDIKGYQSYFFSAEKKGYSGVGIYTKIPHVSYHQGFGEEKFDCEGRVQWLEWEDWALFNIYFPNGQKDDQRLQYKMDFYHYSLEFFEKLRKKGKKLIILGDYNTAHKEIDLANPKSNSERSGFLQIERDWLTKIVDMGYIDTFREFNDQSDQYSWWTYRFQARKNNVGWRIDYAFLTEQGRKHLKDGFILQDVEGSDHCPVGIVLEFDKEFGKG